MIRGINNVLIQIAYPEMIFLNTLGIFKKKNHNIDNNANIGTRNFLGENENKIQWQNVTPSEDWTQTSR